MSELIEALSGAADGAFVVDDELRIRYWNGAAEKITGFGSRDVLGQKCYQILQGYDEERRLICKDTCHVAELALKSEPVSNYDIRSLTNKGDKRWLNMSIITAKMGGNGYKKLIVHFFRDVTQKKEGEIFFRKILETASRYHNIPIELNDNGDPQILIEDLTGREREVLNLLTRGLSSREMAEALSISQNTVRNHIQHILKKLQVHSRLEAVTYALNNGLSE